MEVFNLKEGEEFIELNNLLKILGWVATGGQAKVAIKEGTVVVNGETETRVRKKMYTGDTVVFGTNKGEIG